MNSRDLPEEIMDFKDAKLRIYMAIKKAYDNFKLLNYQVNVDKLISAFKINFSEDDAIGKFLHQSSYEINKALEMLSSLYSNSLNDKENLLRHELFALTFTTSNKYIKAQLPRILGFSNKNLKIALIEDPLIAKDGPQLLHAQYNAAKCKLEKSHVKMTKGLELEINNLINSFKVDTDSPADVSALLLQEYKAILLQQVKNELDIVHAECLNCLFHVNQTLFADIKKSIRIALGLRDIDNVAIPLKNYIQLAMTRNHLLTQLHNKASINHNLEFTTFLAAENKQQYLESMNTVIVEHKDMIARAHRKQMIEGILARFCEKEAKIFQEKGMIAHNGYFSHLQDNLHATLNSDSKDNIYDILFASILSPDDPILHELLNIHAELLILQSQTQKNNQTFFDMDDIPSIDNECLDHQISSQDIQARIDIALQLYVRLLSGEKIQASDLPNLHYQVKEKPVPVPVVEKKDELEDNEDILVDNLLGNDFDASSGVNFNILEQQAKLRLEDARLRLEDAELRQTNIQLKKECIQLKKKNVAFEQENTQRQLDNINLQQANDLLKTNNIALQKTNDELAGEVAILQETNVALKKNNGGLQQANDQLIQKKNQLKLVNAQILMSNTKLISSNVINHFNLFYKDYRSKAYKGFLGIFSTHGNAGREVAGKFKQAFDAKINASKIDSSQPITAIIKAIQLAFKSVINEQSELLSSGGYRAHSFKTYLLAYNDYLNSLIQTPSLVQDNIVNNHHEKTYVLNTSVNIEANYKRVFTSKPMHNNVEQQQQQPSMRNTTVIV